MSDDESAARESAEESRQDGSTDEVPEEGAERDTDERAASATDSATDADADPEAAAGDDEAGHDTDGEPPVDEAGREAGSDRAGGGVDTDGPVGRGGEGADGDAGDVVESGGSARRRFTPTTAVVVVLMMLLGFTTTVVMRNVADDPASAALGQEDLVRILANLDAHEERLREEIAELRETRRRLTTAGESQQEALAEAERRADELGVLAGTLPVEGPGIVVEFRGGSEAVTAARLLDAVQELRAAGAEAMQFEGGDGTAVRVVASTYFVDEDGQIVVDGRPLPGPWTLTVVGEPETLEPALQIPGGVVELVERDGGTVSVHEEPGGVEVSAVRGRVGLEHTRPGS